MGFPISLLSAYTTTVQVLPPNTTIFFESLAVPVSGPSFTYNALLGEVTFLLAGTYDLTFGATVSAPIQAAISAVMNGSPIPGTIHQPQAGVIETFTLESLIQALPGDILTIRNIGPLVATIVNTVVAGDTLAFLVLKRVG